MPGEGFKRTGHDHSEVPRQSVGCFGVREGAQFWCHGNNDKVGEPLIESAGKQRLVQTRLEWMVRHARRASL